MLDAKQYDFLSGQYHHPLCVLTVRVGEKCRDVSREIAADVLKAAAGKTLPDDTRVFVTDRLAAVS